MEFTIAYHFNSFFTMPTVPKICQFKKKIMHEKLVLVSFGDPEVLKVPFP